MISWEESNMAENNTLAQLVEYMNLITDYINIILPYLSMIVEYALPILSFLGGYLKIIVVYALNILPENSLVYFITAGAIIVLGIILNVKYPEKRNPKYPGAKKGKDKTGKDNDLKPEVSPEILEQQKFLEESKVQYANVMQQQPGDAKPDLKVDDKDLDSFLNSSI
jgi:hypothetical protein